MKVAVVIVEGSIASLKTAANALLTDILAKLLTGMVELTVGGVTSGAAPVVQLHW
jgi:hypothetical protein